MFLRNFADDKAGVPYGIALGIGGLLTYPQSPLMVWALARLAGTDRCTSFAARHGSRGGLPSLLRSMVRHLHKP